MFYCIFLKTTWRFSCNQAVYKFCWVKQTNKQNIAEFAYLENNSTPVSSPWPLDWAELIPQAPNPLFAKYHEHGGPGTFAWEKQWFEPPTNAFAYWPPQNIFIPAGLISALRSHPGEKDDSPLQMPLHLIQQAHSCSTCSLAKHAVPFEVCTVQICPLHPCVNQHTCSKGCNLHVPFASNKPFQSWKSATFREFWIYYFSFLLRKDIFKHGILPSQEIPLHFPLAQRWKRLSTI